MKTKTNKNNKLQIMLKKISQNIAASWPTVCITQGSPAFEGLFTPCPHVFYLPHMPHIQLLLFTFVLLYLGTA